MRLPIRLWIIFGLVSLEYCRGQDLKTRVEELVKKLEREFENLGNFLNSAKLNDKVAFTNKPPLKEDEIKNILTKSKSDTEKIITKTNNVVNKIQETLTSSFLNFSMIPPKKYNIECANESFIFYYKAKSLKNSNFTSVSNCLSQTLPLQKDPYLDQVLTNRDTATAHVPTNVYDASKDIQGVADWTSNIDTTFLAKKDDFQLKWQFFCSNTGLFKIFPGIRWKIQIEDSEKDSTLVDFFDCRSEQWYLEATAYPKKMMIMVDKSGSMKGRRRIIANHTIYEILNTLTENDFFNILLFTKDYFFADSHTSGILMQATDKNKKYILDQLARVFSPDGIAEYDIGLRASFKVLYDDKINQTDSNLYNYLLMIITDGAPLPYQELIEELNKDVDARIFTYLIGQGTTERDMVTSMACKNKGYAVEIATLADVKENVQKYLNIVARKNALMRNSFIVWTGVHQMQMQPTEELLQLNNTPVSILQPNVNPNTISMTFATNTTRSPIPEMTTNISSINSTNILPKTTNKIEIFKDKPIKLFVTASKAAFDETNATATLNNGVLLGAAGVDISMTEFIKTVPFWKIGVNAYLFGITSNGFVLFHPKFRPQFKKFIKYFYRNVDISELEIDSTLNIMHIRNDQIVQSDDKFQLRTKMLDQSPDAPAEFAGMISTHQIMDDFKTAFQIERNYYIVGISDTSYKFGLAIPVGQQVPLYSSEGFKAIGISKFKEDFREEYEVLKNQCHIIKVDKNQSGMTMKNYEFCQMNQFLASLHMKSPFCALIEVFTNESALDECVSNEPDRRLYLSNIHSEIKMTAEFPEIWSRGTATNSSIQQVFSMHHFGLIRYYNYDTLSYEHFITNHSLGTDDPLYQETVLISQKLNSNVLVARPLPNEVIKKNIAPTSLVFTVTTPMVQNGVYVGIMGVQAKYDYFYSILTENSICSDSSKIECFLITQSSLILINNLDIRQNGDMLKEHDCALMESLVKNGIFSEQWLYDFQALCPNLSKQQESFSMRLIDPFTRLFGIIFWVMYELFLIIQNFSLTSLMWHWSAQEDNYGMPSNFDDSSVDMSVFTTDSSMNNIYSSGKNTPNTNSQTESKSKRQHELDVKNTLKVEIQHCYNNNQDNEIGWSSCIQKAVGNICRQDKVHVSSPNDQHVDRLTSMNTISHCETACLILQSEYPKVWQDLDDCKQPLKLCHKIAHTFTSIFPSSIVMQSAKSTGTLVNSVTTPETYFRYQEEIIKNRRFQNDGRAEPTSLNEMKNGTICGVYCPAKTWFVKPIRNTNLLLVVIDKPSPGCSCDCSSGFSRKNELSRESNQSIENPYIVKPNFYSEFINFTKIENSTTCTDNAQRPCRFLGLLLLLSVLLSVLPTL